MTFRLMTPEEVAEQEKPRCAAQPSRHSTARCEMPEGHRYEDERENFHAGRTRGGYWKFWPVEEVPSEH
jgi:hypothetical protein